VSDVRLTPNQPIRLRDHEAIPHLEDAIAILAENEEHATLETHAPDQTTVTARTWLPMIYAELGEFDKGAARGAEALRIAKRLGTEYELLWSRIGIGRLNVVRGDFAAAIEVLEPALPLAETGELVTFFSRIASSLGTAYTATGRIDAGLPLL
jgi:hypothetical protein